jgi:hypothetical protein
VASTVAVRPSPYMSVYGATKALRPVVHDAELSTEVIVRLA